MSPPDYTIQYTDTVVKFVVSVTIESKSAKTL